MSYIAEVDPVTNVVMRVVVADSIEWCAANIPGQVQTGTNSVPDGLGGFIDEPVYTATYWAETTDPYLPEGTVTYCGPGYGFDPAVREQFALPYDVDAATIPDAQGNYAYEEIGSVVFYNGKIWRNTIASGTPNVWTPGTAGWREYTMGTTFPVWLQPTGSADAYLIGEKVEYNGKSWVNVTAANVWSPGTGILWEEIIDESATPPGPQQWVQPTGSADDYNIGDQVTFNGSTYESLINGNVWSPTAYPAGWTLIP